MAEIRSCKDCIHIEVCALCVPPLPVCDSFLNKHDVVEVVRCKDCKHWHNGDCYRLELSLPNDFCSYGERKDNG